MTADESGPASAASQRIQTSVPELVRTLREIAINPEAPDTVRAHARKALRDHGLPLTEDDD